MPTNVPVPSKGALRALRHLALGTSCTVAVGAGILTEDRRRRIHTARKVYDNAQTLKSVKSYRGYHATLDAFENELVARGDESYWLPSKVAKSQGSHTADGMAGVEYGPEVEAYGHEDLFQPERNGLPEMAYRASRKRASNAFIEPELMDTWSRIGRRPPRMPQGNPPPQDFEQSSLARGGSNDLDALVARFLLGLKHIERPLSSTDISEALKCFELAGAEGRDDMKENILHAISQNGPIDEANFELFKPELVMHQMLRRVKSPHVNNHQIDQELLKKVVSIYLATFTSKPSTTHNDIMHNVGQKLCSYTCEAGLHNLTLKVYTRHEQMRGERPPSAVQHLIAATHARKTYGKLFRYFKILYTQTRPDQVEFYKTGSYVLDGLLEKGNLQRVEDFLQIASKMAASASILTSSTWFLKLLDRQWHVSKNLDLTKALFDRLEPLVSSASHPQALFATIIQYCVEAGDEGAALLYQQQLVDRSSESAQDVRIMGHLALAKARRGDWTSVKEDLHRIARHTSIRKISRRSEFEALFTPILKTFAVTHEIGKTEEFLHEIVESCKLEITPYLFNLMLSVYAKTGELSSLERWIDFASVRGSCLDAISVNSILSALIRTSDLSFREGFHFYGHIRKLEKESGVEYTNATTRKILRQLAISKSQTAEERKRHLAWLEQESPQNSLDSKTPVEAEEQALLSAYGGQNYEKVISLYERAQDKGVDLGDHATLLAVKAVIEVDGQSGRAKAMIKIAQDRGRNVASPIAIVVYHQLRIAAQGACHFQDLLGNVRKTLNALKSSDIEIAPAVLTKVVGFMVENGRPHDAIRLWESSVSELGLNTTTVDLATLTVLLEARIQKGDGTAIPWAVDMLVQNNLKPDSKFCNVLKDGRRRWRRQVEECPDSVATETQNAVQKALKRVRQMRLDMCQSKQESKDRIIKIISRSISTQADSKHSFTPQRKVLLVNKQVSNSGDLVDAFEDGVEAVIPTKARAAAM